MADVERFVDTDADSAGGDGTTRNHAGATRAYLSMSEWESAEEADIKTATDTHRVRCAGSTADSTAVTVSGWTTDASFFITIQGDDAAPDGDGFYSGTLQYNTSFYRMEQTGGFATLTIDEDYTVIDGIQIKAIKTGNFVSGINLSSDVDNNYVVRNSRVITALSGTDRRGINHVAALAAGETVLIENCIVAGWVGTSSCGIRSGMANFFTGTISVLNCSVYDCNIGILADHTDSDATLVAKNNCLFNNVDDFSNIDNGTLTIDFCATEQGAGEGTNAQTITTPTDDMEDPENPTPDSRDVRLKTTGVLEANGTASGTPTTDIIGTARDGSTPDIGAWEIVAAGGVANPWYAYAQQ